MLKNKFVIGLIGFYIFWLCIMPLIVSKTISVVCENLSHTSQYEIKISKPVTRFSILPIVKLYSNQVEIKAKNDSASIFVENISIKARLLPLLSGKIRINDLTIGSIKLSTNLMEDLALDKDFFIKFENRNFRLNSINIRSFEAELYQKDLKTPIIYQGKDFKFERKNRYIKLQNNSTLNVAGKISKVTSNLYLPKNNDIKKTVFDIEVANIDITPLRTYFKHYLPQNVKEFKGGISIHANKDELITDLKNCAILMNDSAQSIIFPSELQLKSKFKITKDYIKFEHVDIKSKNIHIAMDGKISEYLGKTKPTLALNMRINRSSVEDIVNLLPAFKVEEIDVYKLKKYKFYGEVLANFSIKGRLPEPDVFGDIYIDNGVLVKPIPNTTKGATIKLNLSGKHANYDVVVPAGNLEKVWVKGTQELYNVKYAELTVKSTDSVDLKSAQNVINPLHEVLNFIVGPVPIMDINGKGNIDILVKGNRKNPHIWGVFNIYNAKASFNDMPNLWATNTDLILKFNDQNVTFTNNNGLVNNKAFKLNGSCNLAGNFSADVLTNEQPTSALYKAIQTSKIIPDLQKILPKVDSITGLADLNLKVYGDIKDINSILFNKNLFAKGEILVKDNDFVIQNIGIEKTNGKINFENMDANADIKANIGDLPLSLKAKIKDEIADLIVDIPRLNPNFLVSEYNTRVKQYLPYISVNGKYKGNINEIQYEKLNLQAKVLSSNEKSKIKFDSTGLISIANNKITIKNIKGYINNKQNTFDINLVVDNAFSDKPDSNGYLKLNTPDLSLYNEILASDILPDKIRDLVKDYEFKKGVLNLKAKVVNNKLNAFTDLTGVSFMYLPLEMPVEIVNGSLGVKNNNLKLNKINLLADNMPVLLDGDIKDVFDKKNFNLYINSKPIQEFIDKYINKNQIYPIKIKGDIVYWVRLKGVPENYDLKAEIDLSKDSSIYHFGATIGDIENAIKASIDSKVMNKNIHKIREFSYDKMIDSQSGRQTRLNMLRAWGGVEVLEDNLAFENLHIKTTNPTDARIFNIIFRKPNIKQGQFTSDLKINGKLSNAKVLGDFKISETNIPFMDTTMKNIELVFKDKVLEFSSKGEIMGNDVAFDGVMKNKLTVPYVVEKASLHTKELDLNRIINKIKIAEVDSVSTFESLESFDLNSIITKNFKIKADTVHLRNIHATNFEALTSLSDKGVFNVSDFRFNIAQGDLGGKYSYDTKTSDMGLKLQANGISANDISWALFDLNNQIYGDLTGDVDLSCNGEDFNKCMETLTGETTFVVKDGRMPKLGSLEYLLKAGNLVKGGFTGLSINGVIDLISPMKTGEFSEILGKVRIKDGIARNIEITTQGKDLSLYVGGTYNFATSVADMEVLGLLSRKISNLLGPVGNVSINTLFNVIPGVDLSKDSLILEKINKIPALELSSKTYRKFIANIKGNINGEDYVTSFKWIN